MLGRIVRSLNARGAAQTLKLSMLQPYLFWRERRYNRSRLRAQAEFDREHSVDTGGIVYLGDLAIPSENAAYGTRYGPTLHATFQEMMAELPIDHQRFTFIDIGSGRGQCYFMRRIIRSRKLLASNSPPICMTPLFRTLSTTTPNRSAASISSRSVSTRQPISSPLLPSYSISRARSVSKSCSPY
jgi:hypothetical protein